MDSFFLQIFTRILRSLNLPVGSNQVLVPRFLTNAYDIGHAVMWITAMMVLSFLFSVYTNPASQTLLFTLPLGPHMTVALCVNMS